MDMTPRLKLPYIAPQQAQKQVTYNEAMRTLDILVQPVVKSQTIATPPGSPAEGDAYLVAASPTGAWTGKAGHIACFVDGSWRFFVPLDGWLLYVEDDDVFIQRQSGSWTAVGSSFSTLGINATADLSNRFALSSDVSLFSHDGANHRLVVNKAATGDTASQIFQTGLSGRAELGLTADDDFHLKVSPDGSVWQEALTIDRSSAAVTMPAGRLGFPATQNPSSDPNTLDDYEEGSWTPSVTFGGASVGVTYGGSNGGRYTKIGRLCIATFLLQLSSKGSSTGAAQIAGLPFASLSSSVLAAMSVGWAASVSGLSGTLQGTVGNGATTVSLYASSGGSSSAVTNSNFSNSSQISGVVIFDAA
jgi:hypothetical protein